MKLSLLLLLLASSTSTIINAQFTCSLSATDEDTCLSQTDGGPDHCVWCALSSFGFCVSETQAESMEQNIPGVQCDRYAPASDDDSVTPDDDGGIDPTDDAIPDDFWMCLQDKTSADCLASNCTWCDTKAGFGLCMTGPTADSAAQSDWFDCHSEQEEEETVMVEASSTSSSSDPSFDNENEVGEDTTTATDPEVFQDAISPYDPSCMVAFFAGGETADACAAATDQDGAACQTCLYQNTMICLSPEQADISRDIGVTCGDKVLEQVNNNNNNPYDPTCTLAYLQGDQSKESCTTAVDMDGTACEYCSLTGMPVGLCLTADQANMAIQLGIQCDDNPDLDVTPLNPYDPTCELAFLAEQTKDACIQAVDQDGAACEYCSLQGADGVNLCLTHEQAEIAQQVGISCEEEQDEEEDPQADQDEDEMLVMNRLQDVLQDVLEDPYDTSCVLAFLQDQTAEACKAAVDQDGRPCEWCDLQGMTNLCLNADQADMAAALGVTCDAMTASNNNKIRGSTAALS